MYTNIHTPFYRHVWTTRAQRQRGTMRVVVVALVVMVVAMMLDWTQATPQYGVPKPEPRPVRKPVVSQGSSPVHT